jgi:hypothetical protein
MQLTQLGVFFAAMILLIVCGCILTRRSTKSPPNAAEQSKTETTDVAEPPLGA